MIFTDELTQPVACRAIATRLVARNVLISHTPKLKSKNANRSEVRLHKMDAKLLSSQAIN